MKKLCIFMAFIQPVLGNNKLGGLISSCLASYVAKPVSFSTWSQIRSSFELLFVLAQIGSLHLTVEVEPCFFFSIVSVLYYHCPW